MGLLFPLGLLALAAVLVPLVIHLARRHVYAPLEFAALRWLRAKVRPRQRIRFDEWPLLLVRLLLLAALALLLARPVLHGSAADTHAVTAVAPGLDGAALRGADRSGDWRWLAPGFPPLHAATPATPQPLASLLRELDRQLPAGTPLTVYVPDPLPGLDAQRPRLSRSVRWQPVPVTPTGTQDTQPRLPQLQPGGGEADAGSVQVLDALQRAWSGQALAAQRAPDSAPEAGQIGVWLSPAPLPDAWQAWLQQGGTVLLATPGSADHARWSTALRDADDAPLLEQRAVGEGRLLRFTAALSPSALPALREADLPRRLLSVLAPAAAPQRAVAATQAPLTGALAPRPVPRDLVPWLLVLIVVLFALERMMATARRREVGA
ncbi:BatA domain-containing protein [Stenotrophomonas sp. LGBM10]|uniref:BatA domain-containing protein n=1 Tax=Stenotrophomonas sp. LGBM10 TaxID=3390038 RepID=UPI00398B74D4